MTKKFAVTRTIGNDEKVLKVFDDDKESAIAYGAEVAKTNTEGVISCVQGLFNNEGKMCVNYLKVYEVW